MTETAIGSFHSLFRFLL